jgi:indolepyruvate ferredoxin oxidoreductase beta subunit
VTAWDRGRQARGREPWALPLKVGSHSVFGMASLRLLSSLKWLRRRGSRFAEEQALIERWLAAVEAGTREAGRWATSLRCAAGSSRATAAPTNAARRTCCT